MPSIFFLLLEHSPLPQTVVFHGKIFPGSEQWWGGCGPCPELGGLTQTSALSLPSCVTLGKSLNLSSFLISICRMRNSNVAVQRLPPCHMTNNGYHLLSIYCASAVFCILSLKLTPQSCGADAVIVPVCRDEEAEAWSSFVTCPEIPRK